MILSPVDAVDLLASDVAGSRHGGYGNDSPL